MRHHRRALTESIETEHYPLDEQHILVVEDDYLLAMELRRELKKAGANVIGPVPSVDLALELVDTTPGLDAAVLDVNLLGERSYPIADVLVERDIPFVFVTAYVDGELHARYSQIIRCDKPLDFRDLEQALLSVLQPMH